MPVFERVRDAIAAFVRSGAEAPGGKGSGSGRITRSGSVQAAVAEANGDRVRATEGAHCEVEADR